MSLIPLSAMVLKDLQLFFSDRRSVIVSFVVPIAIASFFGSIFSGPSRSSEPAKIAVAIIDQDSSPISTGIVAGMQADKNFKVTTPPEAEARDAVQRGSLAAAVIIPPWLRGIPETRYVYWLRLGIVRNLAETADWQKPAAQSKFRCIIIKIDPRCGF